MKKETFSEKLEKWGNESATATGSEGCVTFTAQYILLTIVWLIVSGSVIGLADSLGFRLPLDLGFGLGGSFIFSLLLGVYYLGPTSLKAYLRASRYVFIASCILGFSIPYLVLASMPFFASLYPKPTCDEIRGAGFADNPAWTSINTEMMSWVSEEYLLNRNQIELKTNSPLVTMNELRWKNLKAGYWLAYPAEPNEYYPRYWGVFWKGDGARLKDVRSCLGEPTDYLITQSPESGKPQALYIWYASGLIGFGELPKESGITIDEVAITKMYFGPRDFLRTADDLARSLGHDDISTPLPWSSVEEIKLP